MAPTDPAPSPGPVPGLLVEVTDGALRLTLDRPDAHNALTPAMVTGLAAEIEGAVARDDVRVIVLAGRGPAFCAGADIRGDAAHERFDVSSMDAANRLVRAVVGTDRPVLAAVHGAAAGVGAGLALAADVIVAHESASFLLAFARIGFMPDGGTSATVAAAVGRPRAMRMGLLAEPLTAAEAYAAGLVTHLADAASYDTVVDDLVSRLVAGAPLAQAATKRAVNAATLGHLEETLERERSGQSLLMRTADVAEGMRAFNERRRPEFRGE